MLIIRAIEEEERAEAHELIRAEYARSYGITTFHQHPSTMLAAFDDGTMVGTIGISRPDPSLEMIEAVLGDENRRILSSLCKDGCGGEIERLAVRASRDRRGLIPSALILGVLAFSHREGISSLIAIVKPKLRDFAIFGLHLPIHVLPERLHLEKVPGIYTGYFRAGPEPCAIVLILDQNMMTQVRSNLAQEIFRRNVQIMS